VEVRVLSWAPLKIMTWLDKLIIKLFKWNFYKKYQDPKEYYVKVLRDLDDDYIEMYFLKKQKII
jgi:hypothetical protein